MDAFTILDCSDPNFLAEYDDNSSNSYKQNTKDTWSNTTTSDSEEEDESSSNAGVLTREESPEHQQQKHWYLMESLKSIVWSSRSSLSLGNDRNEEDVDDDDEASSTNSDSKSFISLSSVESLNTDEPLPGGATSHQSSTCPCNNHEQRKSSYGSSSRRSLISLASSRVDYLYFYEEMNYHCEQQQQQHQHSAPRPPPMEAFMALKMISMATTS